VRKVALAEEMLHDLEDNLLLFFTRYSRPACVWVFRLRVRGMAVAPVGRC